jgi:ADP-L-glycero-D-manno-heptose 6-epimerase
MKGLSSSHILVTGGAGFIGSALIWELNRRGAENIVVTDLLGQTEKWRNLAPLRFADYLEADDLLAHVRSDVLGKFDFIFHLGACSTTTERDCTYLIRNNYEYTKSLASWALDHQARFVYASSAATYGDGSAGMSDADPATLPQLRPLNMYGYSKHLFDLHAWRHGFLDRLVGVKYFNVFGPNEDHKGDMRSVVHKAFAQVRDSGCIRLFKSYRPDFRDGEQQRDFLYVKDAVAMTLHLAVHERAGGLFNVGSGAAHRWNELAEGVFAAMNCPPRIEYIEMPEELRAKYQYYTQADISRLRATGYHAPVTPLRDAVRDYVQNYLAPEKRLGDGKHE